VTEREGPAARARLAAEALASRGLGSPWAAVVLGSGMAGAVEIQKPRLAVGFNEIPGLPQTSVIGHPGRITAGNVNGLELLVIEGRFHLYEQHGAEKVRLLASLLKAVGVRELVLTTAAGALAPHLKVGEFVVARDYMVYPLGGGAVTLGRALRLAVGGPAGAGPRSAREPSPDVVTERAVNPSLGSEATGSAYSPGLAARLERACMEAGLRLQRGVLAFAAGPCYETAAEARLLRSAGADVVSMSAGADTLAARAQGLDVGCICCVTNSVGLWCARGADHREVLSASGAARAGIGEALKQYASLTAEGRSDRTGRKHFGD
jgi:purine-nucleoside phosphorylase